MPLDIEQYAQDFFKLPPLDQKALWYEVFQKMAVHTRMRKPEELLLKTRPNEEPEVLQYRLCNYEPITYGSMNRALNSLFRIVSTINYTLNIPDETRAYINQRIFTGRNAIAGPPVRYTFEMWFANVLLKRFIEDPNGLLLWLPTGAGVDDSGQKVAPKPHLVYSDEIVDVGENHIAVIAPEKSLVKKGNKEVWEGDVYYIIDDLAFYKLVQTGLASRKQFDVIKVYQHNLGEVPVAVLGGDMNADGYYESFFAPYVAFGNQAVRQFSDWQAIMVNTAHPYTEEFYVDCEINVFEKASNPNPDELEEEFAGQKKNAITNGNAKPMPRSPYGVRIRRVPPKNEAIGENVLPVDVPSRRYIHPDVSVVEYAGDAWVKLIGMAEQALHLNNEVGSNIAEKTQEMQKEEHDAMLARIGGNYFELMLSSLRWITAYLKPTTAEKATAEVSVSKPLSYRVKSEQDIVDELGKMKNNSVPALFISAATIELARKRFANDPVAIKIFDAIEKIDPLFVYNNAEKQSMVMNNNVTDEQVTRSILSYPLLREMAKQKTPAVFIAMTLDQIAAEFEKMVLPLIPPAPAPIVDESGNAFP